MEISFPQSPPIARGFRFQRLLGAGASAQVWLVLGEAGGEWALKCFPALEPTARSASVEGRAAQLRQEIRICAKVQHEHLLAVRDVVKLTGAWAGGTGLLMDYAAGGSLAAVLASRGRISPGELVTTLVPMCQMMALLHRQGIVHGDISAANVLFSETGKPLLTDFGAARVLGDRLGGEFFGTDGFVDPALLSSDAGAGHPGPDAAADVYALSALGWWCLSGDPPDPAGPRFPMLAGRLATGTEKLFGLLASGMDPERRRRPAAADLARELFRAAPAEPLDLMPSVHSSVLPRLLTRRQLRSSQQSSAPSRSARSIRPITRAGRRRRARSSWPEWRRIELRRIGLRGGAVIVLVMGIAMSWLLLTRSGQESRLETAQTPAGLAPVPGASSGEDAASLQFSDDPALAIHALTQLRAEAFRLGDAGILDAVNVPGSPASAEDRQTMAELVGRARVLAGFSATVRTASTVSAAAHPGISGSEAPGSLVAATVELSPFAEQDAAGTVFERQPASRLQELTFRMVNQSGRWLIAEVQTTE